MPYFGAGNPAAASKSPKAPRSSARSIASGGVPTIGTPASARRCANPSGVWPPSCTMTPTTPPVPCPPPADCCSARKTSQHVLERQRLEVEPVGGVVVGGHRLRVAVDHHGLKTGLRQRGCRVHTAVVEFDALADAVRSRPEDQHLGPLGLRGHLRLGRRVEFVAAVVVGRLGLELRRAGVHRLVHRVDAEPRAQRAHPVLPRQFRPQRGDLAVREPAVLGPPQQVGVEHRGVAQLGAQLAQLADLGDEPRVDTAGLGDLLDRGAQPQRQFEVVEPAFGRGPQPVQHLVGVARPGPASSRSRRGRSPATASPCRAPR